MFVRGAGSSSSPNSLTGTPAASSQRQQTRASTSPHRPPSTFAAHVRRCHKPAFYLDTVYQHPRRGPLRHGARDRTASSRGVPAYHE